MKRAGQTYRRSRGSSWCSRRLRRGRSEAQLDKTPTNSGRASDAASEEVQAAKTALHHGPSLTASQIHSEVSSLPLVQKRRAVAAEATQIRRTDALRRRTWQQSLAVLVGRDSVENLRRQTLPTRSLRRRRRRAFGQTLLSRCRRCWPRRQLQQTLKVTFVLQDGRRCRGVKAKVAQCSERFSESPTDTQTDCPSCAGDTQAAASS